METAMLQYRRQTARKTWIALLLGLGLSWILFGGSAIAGESQGTVKKVAMLDGSRDAVARVTQSKVASSLEDALKALSEQMQQRTAKTTDQREVRAQR